MFQSSACHFERNNVSSIAKSSKKMPHTSFAHYEYPALRLEKGHHASWLPGKLSGNDIHLQSTSLLLVSYCAERSDTTSPCRASCCHAEVLFRHLWRLQEASVGGLGVLQLNVCCLLRENEDIFRWANGLSKLFTASMNCHQYQKSTAVIIRPWPSSEVKDFRPNQ